MTMAGSPLTDLDPVDIEEGGGVTGSTTANQTRGITHIAERRQALNVVCVPEEV